MAGSNGASSIDEQVVLGLLKWRSHVRRLAVSSVAQATLTMHHADVYHSLAMAEMTALVAAVYREYNTSIAPGFDDKSPAITSRFELFYDETIPQIAVSSVSSSMDTRDADRLPGTHMHNQVYEGFLVMTIPSRLELQESRVRGIYCMIGCHRDSKMVSRMSHW
jgi:hypothetical protein